MRLYLHICCAPCLDVTLAGLKHEFGHALDVRGFFHNPNIHPLIEFRRRLKSVQVLGERLGMEIDINDNYGLSLFLHEVWNGAGPARCQRCYLERLHAAARQASELGFDIFSSTLICSTHQDHGDIAAAGEDAASHAGVKFLYRDLRSFVESVSPRTGIYRQQYCGCVFSEEERYCNTSLHLYRGRPDTMDDRASEGEV